MTDGAMGDDVRTTREQSVELFAELTGDTTDDRRRTACREALVHLHLPLVDHCARRFRNRGEPFDDLLQVASLGLVKAIDRFDPARGTAFSTYAVPTILGELKRYFRDTGWAVHVPRGLQERTVKVDTAVQDLHHRLGRSPSPKELAQALELTEEEVLEAMEAASAYDATSLEQERWSDDAHASRVLDTLETDEQSYELVEDAAAIAPSLKSLPKRERLILHLRFVEDLSQAEIGERIGISQMHVSRLIRRSLARLRDATKTT